MTDRELDALVAEKVMGWHHSPDWLPEYETTDDSAGDFAYWLDKDGKQMAARMDILGYHGDTYRWSPSTTGDGMLAVIEKMRERGWNCDIIWRGEGVSCVFTIQNDMFREGMEAIGPPAPRAVCLAALKALGVNCE